MTIFKYLLLACIFLGTKTSFGKGPLMGQRNRNILRFHPSNTGSKKGSRLFLGNTIFQNGTRNQSMWSASYDNYFNSLKAGLGVYFSQTKYDQGLQNNRFNEVGITFSPKFNITSATNFKKARFTLAPAIFFEYGNKAFNVSETLIDHSFHSTIFDAENPNGIPQQQDSSYTQVLSNKINGKNYTMGIGLQLIGKNGFVQINLPYRIETVQEKHTERIETTSSLSEEEISAQRHMLYTSDFEIGAGRSFKLSKNKPKYLTCIGSATYSVLWNNNEGIIPNNQLFYRELRDEQKRSSVSAIHISTVLRINNLLLGLTASKQYHHTLVGLSTGYQNKNYKLLVTGNLIGQSLFEVTFAYYLKKK